MKRSWSKQIFSKLYLFIFRTFISPLKKLHLCIKLSHSKQLSLSLLLKYILSSSKQFSLPLSLSLKKIVSFQNYFLSRSKQFSLLLSRKKKLDLFNNIPVKNCFLYSLCWAFSTKNWLSILVLAITQDKIPHTKKI